MGTGYAKRTWDEKEMSIKSDKTTEPSCGYPGKSRRSLFFAFDGKSLEIIQVKATY